MSSDVDFFSLYKSTFLNLAFYSLLFVHHLHRRVVEREKVEKGVAFLE